MMLPRSIFKLMSLPDESRKLVTFILSIVCHMVLKSRAIALTPFSALSFLRTITRCFSFSAGTFTRGLGSCNI